MTDRITLDVNKVIYVRVPGATVKLVCDAGGFFGIHDARGAWMPPVADADGHVLDVYDGAEANSDYGDQVESMIDELDEATKSGDLEKYSMTGLLRILFWLVKIHRLAPAMLIVKANNQQLSCRECGKMIGLGRSQTSDLMRQIEEYCPRFFTLLTGSKANSKSGQRRRRKRAEVQHLIPPVGSFRDR